METFLKDKRIKVSVLILIVVISLFVAAKLVNEVKLNSYIGRDLQTSKIITVDGSGEVLAVSDIASLDINLSKDGLTAKESQTLLNESIDSVLKYLKEKGVEDKDIKSEYGGLTPKYSYEKCYSYSCPSNSKIVGYTATQSIVVKVREVDNSNDIRTGLTEIGVTNISGPTFSIDDEEDFKAQARSKAIEEAKAKAEVLASELGVKLGKVVSFSENEEGYYPMYKSSMMMSDARGGLESAPVLPKGENKITSNVTIIYEIR